MQEPVFSTLRTTEPVEGCQPGSITVLLTGYDTTGAVIATKEQLLPTACQWQAGVFRLPLREIGQGVHFISWRITNSGPSEVYLDELQLQTVDVVQENHYYAFGLDMTGVSKTAANSHSYTYNGKELEAETGWHDYGARMYDGQIGRWGAVDAMADSYLNVTPYQYVLNNPLIYIDPTGMFTELFNQNGKKIGEDENGADGNVSIITDRSEANRIKNDYKNGITASAEDVAIGVQTTKTVLNEALNVLERTEDNGGLREEVSIITGGGEVFRGETGPEPTVEKMGNRDVMTAEAVAPSLPEGEDASESTLIHSHPIALLEKDGQVFPQSANSPSGKDKRSFRYYKTNIIVGKIGNLSNTQLTNGSINDPRSSGAVIYNNNTIQKAQLRINAIKKIVKK